MHLLQEDSTEAMQSLPAEVGVLSINCNDSVPRCAQRWKNL